MDLTVVRVTIYCVFLICILAISAVQKQSKFLYIVALLFIWVSVSLSLDSYDISNYRYAYDTLRDHGKEPFYDWLKLASAQLGVPFNVFKLFYGTLITLILHASLAAYTDCTAFAAALLAIFPMLGLATQMRNSVAGVIAVWAVQFLMKKNKPNIGRFLLWLIIAALFHISVLFYIVLLIPLVFHLDGNRYRNTLFVIVGASVLLLLVFVGNMHQWLGELQTSSRIALISRFAARAEGYFKPAGRMNIVGFLYWACQHGLMYVLTEWACRKMKKTEMCEAGALGLYSDYEIDTIQKINTSTLLLIPFYMLGGGHITRLFFFFFPFFYGVILQGVSTIRKRKQTGTGDLVLALLTCYVLFAFVQGNLLDIDGRREFQRILNGITLKIF